MQPGDRLVALSDPIRNTCAAPQDQIQHQQPPSAPPLRASARARVRAVSAGRW